MIPQIRSADSLIRIYLFVSVIAIILLAFASPLFGESINEKQAPEIISTLNISESIDLPKCLDINGNYVYIMGRHIHSKNKGIEKVIVVVDISDPAEPEIIARTSVDNQIWDIKANGDYLYVLYWDYGTKTSGLYIFDISDPVNLNMISTKELFPHTCTKMVLDKNDMFIAGNRRSLLTETRIYRLSLDNPANPVIISRHFTDERSNRKHYYLPDYARKMVIQNDRLLIAGQDDIFKFVISEDDVVLVSITGNRLDYTDDMAVSFYGDGGDDYCTYISGRKIYTFANMEIDDDGKTQHPGGKGVYLAYSNITDKLPLEDKLKYRFKPFGTTFTPGVIEARQNLVCILGLDDDMTGKILFVDFKDPREPVMIGSCDLDGNPQAAEIRGNYIYVAVPMENFYIIKLPDIDIGFTQII
ncbi:beta-propeller domain-containing protein [bacterium]|nr:beta-propeller domain-containing protein [bacterium]